MRFLSLFSGIGGLDLGFERAGMTCVGQVEIDDWCRQLLTRHWPEVPRHDDVRTAVNWWGAEPRPAVDVVVAGFPCQPVSLAGKHAAQADSRWLWPETRDVIRALRPRFAVLENVPGLRSRGLDIVLGELASIGYDAEWDCVSASAVGAPHRRDRIFVIAYPDGQRRNPRELGIGSREEPPIQHWAAPERSAWWATEPALDRVAYGVPGRVDRLRGLGNAVVPQVAEHIGRLVVARG